MSKYAIDLGHKCSPYDIGANGIIAEETIIDSVGELVISKLRDLGHTVIEVRPYLCTSVGNSLWQRYNKSDDNNSDWCISIHANASNGEGHGTEIFTYNAREITEARNILNNLVSFGFADRGIKDGKGLAMVARPQAKAMLIEICFCDNQNDIDIYNSVGVEAIANAIISGLTGQTVTSQYKQGWGQSTYNQKWFYYTDNNGNYYKDKWAKIDGCWYHFDKDGYMEIGWLNDNDDWFYLNPVSGKMMVGWFKYKEKWTYLEEQPNGNQGMAYQNCKAVINGKEYQFDKDGYMI